MSTVKKTPSPIPVSFEQFRKNPIAAVAFCMLLAVSYLYVDLRSGYKEQIEKSNQKIDALDLKIDRFNVLHQLVNFNHGVLRCFSQVNFCLWYGSGKAFTLPD